MIKKTFQALTFLLLMALPVIVNAQPGDPGCSPDDPCPIDNGVILFIVVAVAATFYRIYSTEKRKRAVAA